MSAKQQGKSDAANGYGQAQTTTWSSRDRSDYINAYDEQKKLEDERRRKNRGW